MTSHTSRDDPQWLVHQWVVAGIVSASARFIPIPFVDDLVRDQCRRFVVARSLAHFRPESSASQWKEYYAQPTGCAAGCLAGIAKLPLKLLLFPIRKIILLVTSVRGVPLEIIRTVLLGRTLQRLLQRSDITSDNAAEIRVAFDAAFDRMDFRAVRAAVSDVMRQFGGWKSDAVSSAIEVADGKKDPHQNISTSAPVDQLASKVQAVFESSETAKLFQEFDLRFDEALGNPQ